MKKGFTYISLLVYITLFILLASLTFPFFFKQLNNSYQQLARLSELKELTRLMDLLSANLVFADNITVSSDSISYQQGSEQYTYLLKNNRLARIKTGIFYLSAKELCLVAWQPQKINNELIEINLKTSRYALSRLIGIRK